MPQTLKNELEIQKPSLPGRALNWIGGEWSDAKQRTKSFDPAIALNPGLITRQSAA